MTNETTGSPADYTADQIVSLEARLRRQDGLPNSAQNPLRCPIKEKGKEDPYKCGCVSFKSQFGASRIPCSDDNHDGQYRGCAYFEVYMERKREEELNNRKGY